MIQELDLIACSIVVLTARLHLLQSSLSLALSALLGFDALASQADGHLLSHLPVLEQDTDVGSASDDLLPVNFGNATAGIAFGDDVAGLGSCPADLGLGLHDLAEVDVDGHVGVALWGSDFGAILLYDDGSELEEGLTASSLDASRGEDEWVVGVGGLVDDEVWEVFGGGGERGELGGCGRSGAHWA